MAAELKSLKIKRKVIKASLTRFDNYLNSLSNTTFDVAHLIDRKSKFELLWTEFVEVQLNIDIIENSDENDPLDDEQREAFETQYFYLKGKADKLIQKSRESSQTPSHASITSTSQNSLRLPEIHLPKFAGSYEDWYTFCNTFTSLIHAQEHINKIQKLQYLKSALQGEAAQILFSLPISEENYDNAWELLRARYDNKRLIVTKHIQAIFDLPAISKENYSSLRQIHDGLTKHMRFLKTLGCSVDTWDDLLIVIISNKLDIATIKEWERTLDKDKLPTMEQFTKFLTNRCDVLETIARRHQNNSSNNITKQPRNSINTQFSKQLTLHASNSHNNKKICSFCNADHTIYNCEAFLKLSIENRIKEAKIHNLCTNCLRRGHSINNCNARGCKKCQKRHNSLIHTENTSEPQSVSNHAAHQHSQVLLSTAIIEIRNNIGQYVQCRALLDSGSQSCFISEELVSRLKLKTESVHIPIAGINQSNTNILKRVDACIKSRFNAFSAKIKCLMLQHITQSIPLQSFNKTNLNIPKNIKLADPHFNVTSPIDILIGAEIFWSLLCIGQIKLNNSNPILQKTNLGWIISGALQYNSVKNKQLLCNFSSVASINEKISKFWNLEEYSKPSLSPEEQLCENHFSDNVVQDCDGHFIVKLPFKQDPARSFGDSRLQALKRLHSLERKFTKNSTLKVEYKSFIDEYLSCGHMKLISDIESNSPSYYLPHHAVLKQTSLTTKLRVVFDGSAPSSNGVSLNDILMTGPTIQDDLVTILIRFRMHKVVIAADIAKMYRQVRVHEDDTKYQRILWRDNPCQPIQTFELTTLTYGTTSASFLAIRSLQHLARQHIKKFPIGSKVALRDFYVDDLLTGANTIKEAQTIQSEVSSLLQLGGFELRKWITNCSDTIIDIQNNIDHAIINMDQDQTISTLGLQWNAHNDVFKFSMPKYAQNSAVTKRTILSNIAQIFDPLGLIGPIIVTTKLIMQELWKLNIDWDESVPTSIHTKWRQFEEQLKYLDTCTIPRWIELDNCTSSYQLHGFSDASERAYGACLYVRIINASGSCSTNLLCSKSRIAPIKTISLPKLELCGALLLARLVDKVIKSSIVHFNQIFYWTDSTITLAWIKSTANAWKTFVANRVGEIQHLSNPSNWFHVRTHENPADIISRGALLNSLIPNKLWWKGPSWLLQDTFITNELSTKNSPYSDIPEKRIVSNVCTTNTGEDLFKRYSSYSKLLRITAFCLRFKNNCKIKRKEDRIKPIFLSVSELESASTCLMKLVQMATFSKELNDLRKYSKVHHKSPLLCLNPFLDMHGIIRVGGRLENSNLLYGQKHPTILPKGHPFVKLLILHEHQRNMHSGIQSTLAAIRNSYWILGARSTIREVIHKCVNCFKANPKTQRYLMGNLPQNRVTPSRPFSVCGVDYFGPLYVRESKRRNSKTVKAYGSVFVCFATKAIHIELATDLTTETFLAAMKRFIARRGKPARIYSDNGTNFTGALREMEELNQIFKNEASGNKIISAMAHQTIKLHIIPPRETGVNHLRQVVENAAITFEEMYRVLVQIAILNSRPLTPLSNDPNDHSFLTPGHFLIGDALISIQEPDLEQVSINRLSRWQHVQQLKQHFWARWSRDYLSQLQSRTKWSSQEPSCLQLVRLLLLKEDNVLSPMSPIGRIIATHPGADGIVRAATVKTVKGEVKRAAVKLCAIPFNDLNE